MPPGQRARVGTGTAEAPRQYDADRTLSGGARWLAKAARIGGQIRLRTCKGREMDRVYAEAAAQGASQRSGVSTSNVSSAVNVSNTLNRALFLQRELWWPSPCCYWWAWWGLPASSMLKQEVHRHSEPAGYAQYRLRQRQHGPGFKSALTHLLSTSAAERASARKHRSANRVTTVSLDYGLRASPTRPSAKGLNREITARCMSLSGNRMTPVGGSRQPS